jgi:hypothetical protein
MQHLDPRPFDKPQLDQPALKLGSRQPVIANANPDGSDAALEPDRSGAERLRSARRRVIAGYACDSGHGSPIRGLLEGIATRFHLQVC